MALTDELVEPFERVTEAAASVLLADRYGIPDATATRLDTERDDTFHVASAFGEFVLKVANPADDPLVINLQTAAMGFAAEVDPGIPVQKVLPSLDGDIEADLDGRVMRVLTWLPGELLRSAARTPDNLEAFGRMQGRLAAALEDFRHPAAGRELAWDVERLPQLRPLLEFAPDVAPVLDRFDAGRIAALPHQVVHNDLNLDNVVVSDGHPDFVTGILDFGDVVHTARAADLAVSLSYLLDGGWASVQPVIDGYQRACRLTDDELELLPMLVEGRLAQRILLAEWLAHTAPANAEYVRRNLDLSRAQLAALR